jgi:hypothetical protein
VTGWIGDFFRLGWALFYWNARKTWYRLRGPGRARCPCQNYSDSGRALETQCDAAVFWRKPARFRRVCPLFVETPAGWRCSANAAEVRPFWARAAGFYGGAALAAYLAGTLAVFGVLRAVGYPVGYGAVLLPHRWTEIRGAQEAVYAQRAERELAAGNYAAAVLSLEIVNDLNPRNEAAALSLAQLWQISGRSQLADRVIARTIGALPERRTAIAQHWYRLLLSRGDFAQIKRMAYDMALTDPGQRVPWLNALFFACRQTRDGSPLAALAKASPAPPAWCLELAAIEEDMIAGRKDAARSKLLRLPARPAAGYVPYYHVDRLLALGFDRDALALMERQPAHFSAVEARAFRMRAFVQLGWKPALDGEFRSLLDMLAQPQAATLAVAHLLRFPDQLRAAALGAKVAALAPRVTTENYPVVAAAYLACRQARAEETAQSLLRLLQSETDSRARALENAGNLLAGARRDQIRLDLVLPALAVPVEIVYTLLELFPPPAPSA